MSGNAPKVDIPALSGSKVAVISARWHQEICEALVAGAKRALKEAGIADSEPIYVPGSFELPLAAQFALEAGADAAVVLGVVLRGETPHFDYVCQGVTDGVMQARSGVAGSKEDKGYDSAIAALDLLRVKREVSDRLRK
ncbi:MAG: 6,7-dimethyl-8-ribityllumazine synthase [Actinobacteria bacterium]|nr:6,7-dimethyl-8-ribityllumazine synthase [Actinomycetota bacterium]